MRLRIAFVEPYFGGSHRAFAEGYAAASRHDVVLFTHPASFWKWRMQGGFLTLAAEVAGSVARDGPFDLVFATSMLDLARFLGASRRVVGDVPVVLYMHENQLTYPTAPRDEFDMTYAMTNWASMAAADLVLFNSEFHLREWFAALPGLLRGLPDQRHGVFVSDVMKRSAVLPVGVDLSRFDGDRPVAAERPLVLWNQRWDHDKGPDVFAASVIETAARGVHFDVALAGEQFVSDPTGFEEVRAALGDRVVHYGYADDATYVDLLGRADIVVSTARQEFFGIAITEAVYAGAFPLVPDSLVYPERIPKEHHATCLYNGAEDLVAKLTWALTHRAQIPAVAAGLRSTMAEFDWGVMAPRFDERLELLAASRGILQG
jgi:glycosyltransferase involved in cell wall biosynthesis